MSITEPHCFVLLLSAYLNVLLWATELALREAVGLPVIRPKDAQDVLEDFAPNEPDARDWQPIDLSLQVLAGALVKGVKGKGKGTSVR